MIKKAYRINHHLVVALIASFPYAITWTQHNIPAIVHCTHASDELGNALADVLFGDYNPGGRLVQTWPATMEQLPPMMDYDIRNGRTYMYFKGLPLYPFGFGLSYTSFSYNNLRLSSPSLKRTGEIMISVDIKNTGKVLGDEVLQLYVQHLPATVTRPERELKGFVRVTLQPGETRTVHIPLKASSLAWWDQISKGFIVEKDDVRLLIGSSSADIRQNTMLHVVD
jgi:beta-glucosidase